MAKRRKVRRKKDRKVFSKSALRTHKINYKHTTARGGNRI